MKINNIITSYLFATIGFTLVAEANEISTNSAIMQSMDKVTGRVKQITVPVNSKITYGDFSLVLRACKKRPAEETPENFAFVDVADKSFGVEEYNIFKGWMLSSTPGINAIEHPIYDVWLLECVDIDIPQDTVLLTKAELDARDRLPKKDSVKEDVKTIITEPKEEKTAPSPSKAIRIKDFIAEDKDIEKEIKTDSLSANTKEEVDKDSSQIQDTEAPKNLLDFAPQKIAEPHLEDNNEKVEEIDIDNEIYY